MVMMRKPILLAGAAALVLAGAAQSASAQELPEATRLSVLEAKLSSMEAELVRLEDVKAIKRLQGAYGYYRSKAMGDEVADLFSDGPTATVEIGGRGRYVGKDSIRRFFNHESNALDDGEMKNYIITQGVVNLDPDGKTAHGRWRALIQAGTYGEDGRWIEGPYENVYVKENGVWKFQSVHWYQTVDGSYDQGWTGKAYPIAGPLKDLPPDEPPSDDFKAFPDPSFKPYHYRQPVTGKIVNSVVGGGK
jgi:hypothetical protein